MYRHLIDIKKVILATAIFVWVAGNSVFAQSRGKDTERTLSPFDFGLTEAQTDSARYEVLYNTHCQAVAEGADVSYKGVDTLTIEVTDNAYPIPLTEHNDFNNIVLTVKNSSKEHYLFELIDTLWQAIDLNADSVDAGRFALSEPLTKGTHLLVLEDLHPWVEKRAGYKYGATRRDILLVRNGRAVNAPISPYSTDSTIMSAKCHPTDERLKSIANLTIIRDTSSTAKTYCFDIDGINNLKISNLKIQTPETKNMYADAAIDIKNCTNITFEDIWIIGTYSRKNLYGYGILMNNVWNSHFVRLTARANWGIFGTNNLNNTTLMECDINRFDIHCYGRDVFIRNCSFGNLYNQFSSLFGTLLYDGCRFTDFVPVLIETSYNAYTGFDLTFNDCIFDALPSRNFLISIGKVDDVQNTRPELAEKCWPNLTITNMTVNVSNKVSKVVLFSPKNPVSGNVSVDYISSININRMKFHYTDTNHIANLVICDKKVKSSKSIDYNLNRIELIPTVKYMKKQAEKTFFYPGCIVFNLWRSKLDPINITASRLNYNVNENSTFNIKYTNCDVGMIRYNSNSNGTKRNYNQCTLYLNNADDARYYIDNQAVYTKCTFVPCDDKMLMGFYGSNNDVTIRDCKTTRKGRLLYHGRSDNSELKNHTVKGTAKP